MKSWKLGSSEKREVEDVPGGGLLLPANEHSTNTEKSKKRQKSKE